VTPKPIIKESWPEVLADDRSPLVRPHAAHGTALGNKLVGRSGQAGVL
jgi:hypothetical protein